MPTQTNKTVSTLQAELIELTTAFWDCECKDNYIHATDQVSCKICGAVREDQPHSRLNEVKEKYPHAYKAWMKWVSK